jgi:hypothetical protein
MSVQVESDKATEVELSVRRDEEEYGEYGGYAVVIGGATGGCFEVVGTPEELVAFTDRLQKRVARALSRVLAKTEESS